MSVAGPRIFFVAGVFRSASTWAANVAAAILEMRAPTHIIFADNYLDLFRATCLMRDQIVVKTHKPDSTLRFFFEHAQPPLILTVREPSACVASLMLQFGNDLRTAWDEVVLSCDNVDRSSAAARHLLLRYEDDPRDVASVLRIARHLGVALSDEAAEDIATRFMSSQVRALVDRWSEEGVFGFPPKPFIWDSRSHWHYNHVGTGRDRAREVLNAREIFGLRAATSGFCQTFNYPAAPASNDVEGQIGKPGNPGDDAVAASDGADAGGRP